MNKQKYLKRLIFVNAIMERKAKHFKAQSFCDDVELRKFREANRYYTDQIPDTPLVVKTASADDIVKAFLDSWDKEQEEINETN